MWAEVVDSHIRGLIGKQTRNVNLAIRHAADPGPLCVQALRRQLHIPAYGRAWLALGGSRDRRGIPDAHRKASRLRLALPLCFRADCDRTGIAPARWDGGMNDHLLRLVPVRPWGGCCHGRTISRRDTSVDGGGSLAVSEYLLLHSHSANGHFHACSQFLRCVLFHHYGYGPDSYTACSNSEAKPWRPRPPMHRS